MKYISLAIYDANANFYFIGMVVSVSVYSYTLIQNYINYGWFIYRPSLNIAPITISLILLSVPAFLHFTRIRFLNKIILKGHEAKATVISAEKNFRGSICYIFDLGFFINGIYETSRQSITICEKASNIKTGDQITILYLKKKNKIYCIIKDVFI